MSTIDARPEDLVEPMAWGAILSCWFRGFYELERARAGIIRLPFRITCSTVLLSRTESFRRLGFMIWVQQFDMNCCHPRRAVIEACTRIASQHGGSVEARTTCEPFQSDRLPHDYTPIDGVRRVQAALGLGPDRVPSGQRALLDLARVFTIRSTELPAFHQVSVLARRGWSRFMLAEFPPSATGRALIVDARGTVIHTSTTDQALSLGGWEGVNFGEARAIQTELYRRSWEEQFQLSIPSEA